MALALVITTWAENCEDCGALVKLKTEKRAEGNAMLVLAFSVRFVKEVQWMKWEKVKGKENLENLNSQQLER